MNDKKKQLTLDGSPVEEAQEKIVEEEVVEVIEDKEPEKFHLRDLRSDNVPETKYSEEYVLDLAASDVWIYDLRFYDKWDWEDLERAWNENFRNCNSGNFSYVLSSYKNNGGTFEKIYEVLEKNKTRCWEVLHASVEEDIWRYWGWAVDFAKGRDKKAFEKWRGHALEAFETVNLYRKALGKEPLPDPDIAKISYEEVRGG